MYFFSIFFLWLQATQIFPHFISGTKVDNILDLLLLLLRINRLPYENKLKTAFTLLVYIAVTVGIYALICHLNHQPSTICAYCMPY